MIRCVCSCSEMGGKFRDFELLLIMEVGVTDRSMIIVGSSISISIRIGVTRSMTSRARDSLLRCLVECYSQRNE